MDARNVTPDEYDELPELTDADQGEAPIRRGRGRPPAPLAKKLVTLRLDPDVVERWKASGPGWQRRMNAVLREAMP